MKSSDTTAHGRFGIGSGCSSPAGGTLLTGHALLAKILDLLLHPFPSEQTFDMVLRCMESRVPPSCAVMHRPDHMLLSISIRSQPHTPFEPQYAPLKHVVWFASWVKCHAR